jgi:hypothetical protein
MSTFHWRVGAAIALSVALATAEPRAEQVRRQTGQAPAATPVTVALKIGAAAYNSSAAGSCTHAAKASIYNVLSEMWTVRQEEEGRSLQLTLWKPSDGSAEMFSLSVSGPKASHQVSTVRGGAIVGSGTVTLKPLDKGGAFSINAKTKSGETIAGTIQCPLFTPAMAEGG